MSNTRGLSVPAPLPRGRLLHTGGAFGFRGPLHWSMAFDLPRRRSFHGHLPFDVSRRLLEGSPLQFRSPFDRLLLLANHGGRIVDARRETPFANDMFPDRTGLDLWRPFDPTRRAALHCIGGWSHSLDRLLGVMSDTRFLHTLTQFIELLLRR